MLQNKYMRAQESAHMTIRSMALGAGTLRGRVINVWQHHFHFLDPDIHQHLPPSLVEEFRTIKSQLRGNGSVQETVSGMTDLELQEVANQIFELATNIQSIYNHPNLHSEDYP